MHKKRAGKAPSSSAEERADEDGSCRIGNSLRDAEAICGTAAVISGPIHGAAQHQRDQTASRAEGERDRGRRAAARAPSLPSARAHYDAAFQATKMRPVRLLGGWFSCSGSDRREDVDVSVLGRLSGRTGFSGALLRRESPSKSGRIREGGMCVWLWAWATW